MTTGNSSFVGIDTQYRYRFDARDFDGNAPASLARSVIDIDFYWCPTNSAGAASTLTAPGSSIGFLDSGGTTWFEIASYGSTENISYRIAGGAWLDAGFTASATAFDRVRLRLDLASDSIGFSFDRTLLPATRYDVLSGVSLGGDMDYLAGMRLFMEAENTKNYLDDFNFTISAVPEPAALSLMVAGLLGAAVSRRGIGRR